MGWLKEKIRNHLKAFKNPYVRIYRDFSLGIVTIDFGGGGRCATFTYDGKWVAG
jgi:hypothetical protein